ncbi:MAG: flagellar hook-associated protein FlgK [Oscillospiraceae bacterium]|nr:flagellar hook-associated protein FlgK [Oscillospiraceae bacterium]
MAIRPTFYGFQMAKSALSASQKNIDVTGQNIANINTPGYSRQRADLSAIGAGGLQWKYPVSPSANVGLGVSVDSIQRVRDEFLDVRYRNENGANSRYAAIQDTLGSVETNIDGFVSQSTNDIFTSFMNALQSFQTDTDEVESASLVRSAADQLTRTLNDVASSIQQISDQTTQQLSLVKDSVNDIARSLNDVNTEIRTQAILGPVSNELLDKRDLLLDQLSAYGEVKVVKDPSQGVWVYFGDGDIGDADNRVTDSLLVYGDTKDYDTAGYNTLDFDTAPDPNGGPVRLTWATGDNSGNDFTTTTGQIFGYYEMLNGIGDVNNPDPDLNTKGIPYFMNMLNNFTANFAETFNNLNLSNGNLFVASDNSGNITARNITISDAWQNDPQFLVTSTSISSTPGAARNDNVLRMIDALRSERTMTDSSGNTVYTGSFQQYLTSMNSDISLEVNYNDKRKSSSDTLLQSVDDLRSSVMSVSSDEEAMNLSMYQKSYNAAARYMTVLDEMLNTIISSMGVAGR